MTIDHTKSSDNLTAEEREILEYMLQNEQQNRVAESKIPLCNRQVNAVLSFGQQRSWLVHELNKKRASPYDTLTINLRAHGELNIDALSRSLDEIVHRHEALRTTFVSTGDEPVQVVGEAGPVLEQVDISDLPQAERESHFRELVQQAKDTLFDLASGPLFRAQLIRLGKTDHVLILMMHHIIFDAWSNGILMRELGQLYDCFVNGRSSPLPELPIQYRDFSVWQRNWLKSDVLQKHLDYWTEQLAGLPTLELPTDHPRPKMQTFNGASEMLLLPKELSTALVKLSRECGVTLFMSLLSALGLLLHRYSRQDDISIGTVIANRDREELQELIGFFLNTLVMRLDLSAAPSFDELLERVKKTARDGFAHQHLPFEKLVDEMQLDRETSRTPLFQVTFALLDATESSSLKLKNLELSPLSVEGNTSRFDLEVYATETPDGLVLSITYNTDLYEARTIKRLLKHYKNLLEGVVVDPTTSISNIPMLEQQEYEQLREYWNQASTSYPRNKTVTELFEAQVQRNPQAIAVNYEGLSLSYGELNERANQLARYLQARGVSSEVMVGLYLERGVEMTVAVLGILKAGGVYVPLDLDYPKPRLAFMLADAQVPVLISTSTLQARLPAFNGEVISVDTDWPAIAQQCADNPVIQTKSDAPAYVVYTSGSTGQPKGVEVPHRAIIRLVCETNYFQVDPSDRVAQASNVSFDAATFEIWGALLNGAQLVGVNKEVLLSPKALSEFLSTEAISVLFITTALFNLMARETPRAFSDLRGVMFGGEAVDVEAVRRVVGQAPPVHLLHVYGPTESTTFASWYEVNAVAEDAVTVPIGRPLANTSLYVLDQNMNPVPVGVPGELYIGGDGLARGYLNQPELTAEKFVADRISEDPDARMYRTGDRVRCLEDGNIEFLGRFDHQVKIRGFRIEPGEIEAALAEHPDVSQAVVIVNDDIDNDRRLLAYALPVSESHPEADNIREYLRQRLPVYMVPANVIWLDEFPLTPNGKIDYLALPAPSHSHKRSSISNKPETEMEIIMARIWEEVLDIDDIETNDMFFDLGGHSLLSIKVVEKFAEETGIRLSPLNLLNQTLRQLVAGLEPSVEVIKNTPGKGFFGTLKNNILKGG